ncbi:hypothetical protein C4587_00450 [Candidatus Parcubacteria bacterium]|nr:MAG: hypothetical protein C4587_00450 [Candidatus Parcubacteria bacterium]
MTLLIRNVQVVGGTEKLPGRVDVFVNGDTISAIGSFPKKKADCIVEGNGAYLSPGFIDVNTDSDHFLSVFDDPAQEDFIREGVTTIVGGMCGSSLAPLLYGGLESVQKWTSVERVNVSWHRMDEFLRILEKRPLAVNFATLVGHSTIRRSLIGESIRELTKNELSILRETLGRSLREGAFGLSTGLSYVHSRQTSYPELKFLCQTVKGYAGLYATHLRNVGEGLSESVSEAIKLAKETGVSALISHLVPILGFEKEYEKSLELIEKLSGKFDFHFDIYPHHTTVRPLYTFLPLWAQSGGQEIMVRNLEEEWLRGKILSDLPELGPDDFTVGNVPSDPSLAGKSLRDLGKLYNLKDPKEVLLKLMRTTGLRATILFKEVNFDLVKRALTSKRALVASNAASFRASDPRKMFKAKGSFNTFTAFLEIAQKEKLMPLEDAVRKITKEPAEKLGFRNRGIVQEGFLADLTGFKDNEIKFTVVNGKLIYKDGEFQGWFPGRILRHHISS